MTIDEFWEKYNRCPLCKYYVDQGAFCDYCCWRFPKADGIDKFFPSGAAIRLMNKEVGT